MEPVKTIYIIDDDKLFVFLTSTNFTTNETIKRHMPIYQQRYEMLDAASSCTGTKKNSFNSKY